MTQLISYFDKKTRRRSKKAPQFAKQGMLVRAAFSLPVPVCLETFKDNKSLGRFTLRDEGEWTLPEGILSSRCIGKTIAIGKITKLLSSAEAEANVPDVANLNIGA